MNFTLKDIELFVQIAEYESLTKGASKLAMSAAAASARLKTLEIQLNCSLFNRGSRGVTLTPDGETFLIHAKIILLDIQRIKNIFSCNSQVSTGKIRLLANTTAITEFLPAVLPQFLALHPGISIDLQERMTHEVIKSILENSSDIGIVAGSVSTDGLEAICFSQDQLVLVTPESHELKNIKSIAFKDTLEFDYIGIEVNSTLHLFLADVLKKLGRKLIYRVHTPNFQAMCQMIAAGVGVGILPKSSADHFKKIMKISIIELTDEWAIRERRVIFRSKESLSPCAQDLVNILVSFKFN
jgi:DNA-binding transcriptional LysR family regulator